MHIAEQVITASYSSATWVTAQNRQQAHTGIQDAQTTKYHEHHAARPLDSHPGRVPDDQVGDASGEDDVHDMGSSYGTARLCHPCYTVLDGPATEARMAASRSSASSGFGTRTKKPAVTLKPPGLKGCAVGA